MNLARTLKRHWALVLLTIAATAVAVVLALNVSTGEKKIEEKIARLYTVDDPQFLREMSVLLGPPVVGGNTYVELRNGDEIFPSMLEAIRSARRTITFETYIYWSGDIGRAFADALAERARAGVKVHVLIDWLGSQKIDDALVAATSAALAIAAFAALLAWLRRPRTP